MDTNVYKMDFADKKNPVNTESFPNHEWILVGIKILRDHGISAVSKTSICQELGQSESEFDAIFNGLDSFLFSVLDYWYEKETLSYIDIMDDLTGNAEDIMISFIEILHHADKSDEIAIRNWALKCPNAQKALAKVDRTRMDVGIGLFNEMGFSDKESTIRSKILYTSTIGTEYTSISSSLDQKITMCKLLMVQT